MRLAVLEHSEYSSYRERLIEHLFIGELLKYSWLTGGYNLEVAKPEVDNSGYDLICEVDGTIRHIQLKASYLGGKTARQKVHTKLAMKPSGCIVWIYFDPKTLELGPYYFFGGNPEERLPNLDAAPIARHTKGDQQGFKAERPNIRVLNKGQFELIGNLPELYKKLFSV